MPDTYTLARELFLLQEITATFSGGLFGAEAEKLGLAIIGVVALFKYYGKSNVVVILTFVSFLSQL